MAKAKILSIFAIPFMLFINSSMAETIISENVVDRGGPACPYGYYDYEPYTCAPYGYYGPEWFDDGVFIGAGPWFRGHHEFRGHVDNRFDPRLGYHGPFPERGDMRFDHFRGNEMRAGHIGGEGHIGGGEHGGPGQRR